MKNKIIHKSISLLSKDYTLLTANDEKLLFEKITNGCQISRQTVLLANMRLIYKEVKRLSTNNDVDDMCSEGVIGLLKAIDGFDINLGHRFSTYATWWVRQAIQEYAYKNRSMIAFPREFEKDRRKIMTVKAALIGSGEEPSYEAIAKKTNLSIQRVEKILESNVSVISDVSASMEDEGDDMIEPIYDLYNITDQSDTTFKSVERSEIKSFIEKSLFALTRPEQDVIVQRYWKNDVKIKYIAQQFKKTNQRILQIENGALKKLKKYMVKDGFSEAVFS